MTSAERHYARLGRTGLTVSRLGLGTVNFGDRVDEPAAHRLLDHALDRGINLIDTANIYGWRIHKGHTEEMIGRWLDSRARRDDVVLATKVGLPMTDRPNDGGLSLRHIVAACEASLRRLRTEWIDLYQIHKPDRGVGWDEMWQAMELLVAQGKVRYVGSSNAAGWQLAAGQEAANRRHFLGFASEQCLYNLVTRYPELELIPAAQAYGTAVLVWSPLHSGLLSGVLRKSREGSSVKSAQGRAASALAQQPDTIAAYEHFCAEIDRSPAEVALAWTIARPGVTAVLLGPRTVDHIDDAFRALDQPLSDTEQDELDKLFPPLGHGGPAPDAWISR
ncbi:aldo/keto reductase [Nocardia sp. NPDC050175]|uniref:aldo/keto reductase n=1 Tax=Nocardia sp. NPDC050175 TaxID=3364317 RepID=UPI0037B85BF6